MPDVTIPASLLPRDGRFGSGPSRVRPGQVDALVAAGRGPMGTSHRQDGVRSLVGRVREGLASLFSLPDGWEVVLGNGGTTAFWDAAVAHLVRDRAQACVFGEFSGSLARALSAAPFLAEPSVRSAPPGGLVRAAGETGIDVYAWPHNETSTGVMSPVHAVPGADPDALVLVDGTSAAGGLDVDVSACDVYYFAPQKSFGSDGGLWLALMSPRALERVAELDGADRWQPRFLSLPLAVQACRKDQTLNTPAVATLVMLADQLDWMHAAGGLPWAVGRSRESARRLYDWVAATPWATPFVADAQARSHVVATVDLDASVDHRDVLDVLRRNGIVDVDPYRALGRNQLRVGMFPAVDPDDVEALTACLDFVVARLPGAGTTGPGRT